MNLAGISDYAPGFPFLNVMWGARPWMTKNADLSGPHDTEQIAKIPLDENGYPLELPGTVEGTDEPQAVFTILPNRLEAGKYVLLHDGDGDFAALGRTRIESREPGRIVLSMQHGGGDDNLEIIAITRSKKGDHVRNIRILPVAHEDAELAANPFRPDFLEFCKPWHVLRFMDWTVTNGSLEKEWKERKRRTFYTMVGQGGDAAGIWGPPPSDYTRLFSGGVAIEVLVQLCNLVKIDGWFCVPHRATDEYIREYAKLVKAHLDPSLKAYVEYSNEVWNWSFQQAQWMIRSRIAAEPLTAAGLSPWKSEPDFAKDDGQLASAQGNMHPERTGALFARCFKVWQQEFGDAGKRLVCVCAVQAGWFDTAERTLEYCMEHGGAEAIAPAAYFGASEAHYVKWEKAGESLTAGQVLDDMREAIESSGDTAQKFSALAKTHSVRLITYEGGQHIQPKDQAETSYNAALGAAQNDSRMFDLYMHSLSVWQQAGCDLFTAFSSIGLQGTRWGSWGHAERYGQPIEETPKLRALLEVNPPKR